MVKELKRKLKITNIDQIQFEEADGTVTRFGDKYEFVKNLGFGAFSFVVQAVELVSGKTVALKASFSLFNF